MLIIEIQNTGAHAKRPRYGTYKYVVRVNENVLCKGEITEHDRFERWPELLMQVAKDGARQSAFEMFEVLQRESERQSQSDTEF